MHAKSLCSELKFDKRQGSHAADLGNSSRIALEGVATLKHDNLYFILVCIPEGVIL